MIECRDCHNQCDEGCKFCPECGARMDQSSAMSPSLESWGLGSSGSSSMGDGAPSNSSASVSNSNVAASDSSANTSNDDAVPSTSNANASNSSAADDLLAVGSAAFGSLSLDGEADSPAEASSNAGGWPSAGSGLSGNDALSAGNASSWSSAGSDISGNDAPSARNAGNDFLGSGLTSAVEDLLAAGSATIGAMKIEAAKAREAARQGSSNSTWRGGRGEPVGTMASGGVVEPSPVVELPEWASKKAAIPGLVSNKGPESAFPAPEQPWSKPQAQNPDYVPDPEFSADDKGQSDNGNGFDNGNGNGFDEPEGRESTWSAGPSHHSNSSRETREPRTPEAKSARKYFYVGMVITIICFFCCMPLGVLAAALLVFADKRLKNGDVVGARQMITYSVCVNVLSIFSTMAALLLAMISNS